MITLTLINLFLYACANVPAVFERRAQFFDHVTIVYITLPVVVHLYIMITVRCISKRISFSEAHEALDKELAGWKQRQLFITNTVSFAAYQTLIVVML